VGTPSWNEKFADAWRLLKDAENIDRREELIAARNIALDAMDAIPDSNDARLEALQIYRETWRKDMRALASGGGVDGPLYAQAFRSAVQAHERVQSLTATLHGAASPAAAEAKAALGKIYLEHGDAMSWRNQSEGRRWQALGVAQLKEAKKLFVRFGDENTARELEEVIADRR
jgi:hypothetical protein